MARRLLEHFPVRWISAPVAEEEKVSRPAAPWRARPSSFTEFSREACGTTRPIVPYRRARPARNRAACRSRACRASGPRSPGCRSATQRVAVRRVFATASVPIVMRRRALLSITIGWPSRGESFSASARATMSTRRPAERHTYESARAGYAQTRRRRQGSRRGEARTGSQRHLHFDHALPVEQAPVRLAVAAVMWRLSSLSRRCLPPPRGRAFSRRRRPRAASSRDKRLAGPRSTVKAT